MAVGGERIRLPIVLHRFPWFSDTRDWIAAGVLVVLFTGASYIQPGLLLFVAFFLAFVINARSPSSPSIALCDGGICFGYECVRLWDEVQLMESFDPKCNELSLQAGLHSIAASIPEPLREEVAVLLREKLPR